MSFYEEVASPVDGLRQGDVLVQVPFPGFSLRAAQILDSDAPREVDFTNAPSLGADPQLITALTLSSGIVVNQTCDLTPRPGKQRPILVARVVAAEARIKPYREDLSPKQRASVIRALANPGK